jgi:hypothetical protein
MKERPILFSAQMVRAILEGRKTQTRRAIKSPSVKHPCFSLLSHDDVNDVWWPYYSDDGESSVTDYGLEQPIECPHGQPGDRLWVREAFMYEPADYCWEASVSIPCRPEVTTYRADADPNGEAKGVGWKPSIHMPRNLSRIDLEIVGVRVERLNDISEADAKAEGVELADGFRDLWKGYAKGHHDIMHTAADSFASLWCSINGEGSWDANPWVWVVEFKRVAEQIREGK